LTYVTPCSCQSIEDKNAPADYPVNSLLSLDDGEVELAVVSDVSVGGTSLREGELELMLHRRIQYDDSRGVQEPLNGEKLAALN
jgi:hypothetical protein